MTILVTGEAGYTDSHTVLALLAENFNVSELDNLCNSSFEPIKQVGSLTDKRVCFFQGDIRDTSILASIFNALDIDCVIHFAALKAVGEPATIPSSYCQNNVYGEQVSGFGDDDPTEDGTCKRDDLHVMDLAEGHVAALKWRKANKEINVVEVFNLGTGKATSVSQVTRSFEKAAGQKTPYEMALRRKGDLDAFWADASRAQVQLGWEAKRSLEHMMTDTWRWQAKDPNSYA